MIGLSLSIPKTGGSFNPASLGNLVAWFRFNSGITITGAGVSQWDDVSGNSRHLKQGTDTNRPAKQADGSILFDGVDNFLKTDAFADIAQPLTGYFLGRQVTWTGNERIVGGNNQANTAETAFLYQHTSTPIVAGLATLTFLDDGGDWTLNTYAAQCTVLNGASSVRQMNNGTPVTGAVGTAALGQLTIGAASNGTGPSNCQAKELIVYSAAHNAAQRAQVIAYLRAVGGI